MRPIRLISFGYLHLPTGPDGRPVPPAADRVEDIRTRLRGPAQAIPDLDGRDLRVQDVVAGIHGARELLDNLTAYALLPDGSGSIAIGCASGRHRACALVEILARRIRAHGRGAEIRHLHAHLPRVLTPSTAPAASPLTTLWSHP